MRASHGITPVFDEPNLVSAAGLVPVLALAESAGLSTAVGEHLTLPVANVSGKVRTVVAGMLAGADSIDDLDVLRAGGTARVVGGVWAPSTIGVFLRSFTHGHALQLRAAARELLTGLAARVPTLVGDDDLVFVDLDAPPHAGGTPTIREVHGYAKQGAGFGYSGVRGLNALLAVVSTPSSAPVIVESALRKGATRSGEAADWHFARAVPTVKKLTTPAQRVWLRADSAFSQPQERGRRDQGLRVVLGHHPGLAQRRRRDLGDQGHCLDGDQVPQRDLGRGRRVLDQPGRGRRDTVRRVHLEGQETSRDLPARGPTREAAQHRRG